MEGQGLSCSGRSGAACVAGAAGDAAEDAWKAGILGRLFLCQDYKQMQHACNFNELERASLSFIVKPLIA